MILLYLIGILCSVALFAPAAYIPFYIKWPVALAVVLLIIFFFNLPKKDSIYTTHHNKKKLYNFGLYNPLVMYFAASFYVLGFNFIIPAILVNESVDIVAEIGNIISAISFNPLNNLTIGLILVVVGMLIYWFRNAFRSNASKSSLKLRAFWYVVLTVLSLVVGIYNFITFNTFDIYQYLSTGFNFYIYVGLAGAAILIDLICLLIACGVRASKVKKANKIIEAKERGETPLTNKEKKALKKEAKRNKIINKERASVEKKLAKQEKKINKEKAKIEAKKAKKLAKYNKKLEKIEAKKAKMIERLNK